jgi:hypothetical protein
VTPHAATVGAAELLQMMEHDAGLQTDEHR